MKIIRHSAKHWQRLLVLLIVLGLWFAVTAGHLIPAILLPSPYQVWRAFINLLRFGYNGLSFWQHYGITIGRLIIAVVFAIVLGIPLGLICGYQPKVGAIIDPMIQFVRPIPPLAYYTLLILWLGIGENSKILLLFLAALPPIYLAAYDAVHGVNLEFQHNAASLGANRRQIFTHIIFPAALPGIFTGIRSAIGVAYTTIVSAEMIASTSGIGWMVIDASHYLKSDVMFVDIIIMGLTGMLLDFIVKRLGQHIVHWQGQV